MKQPETQKKTISLILGLNRRVTGSRSIFSMIWRRGRGLGWRTAAGPWTRMAHGSGVANWYQQWRAEAGDQRVHVLRKSVDGSHDPGHVPPTTW